jgi:Caspase domain
VANKALLIANWAYADPERTLEALKGPEHNLGLLAKALSDDSYGLFTSDNVHVERNLAATGIGKAMWDFTAHSVPDDHLLIYYTGHGVRLSTGELGLCGVDAERSSIEPLSFNSQQLRTWLNATRARSKVVVLDCCYAGAFLGGGSVDVDVLDRSFGEGIGVLVSGGMEPVPDSAADGPTPFTEALISVLLDPELEASRYLFIEDAFAALQNRRPRLIPAPRYSPGPTGSLPLAKRPVADDSDDELPGWLDYDFDTVDLQLSESELQVTIDGSAVSHHGLDLTRQMTLRRLPQLIDAVVRSSEQDEVRDRVIRKAWDCVGTSLFEALPVEARERICAVQAGPGRQVFRLRVGCAGGDRAQLNQLFPWEYLLATQENQDDLVRPLGMREHVVVERVYGGSASGREPARATSATVAGIRPRVTAMGERAIATAERIGLTGGHAERIGPAGGHAERRIEPSEPAGALSIATVGLVNGLPGQHRGLGLRFAQEVKTMKRASLMYELGNTGNRADWPSFRDTLAQNPHHLVLALPVRRRDGEVRLGFDGMPDWRSLSELVNTLRSVDSLRTLTLITVAAEPGRDTYRGVAAAAQHFAYRLAKPVIYSCHRTEYCSAAAAFNKNELQTFPGLLIGALAHGKPLDRAFCYARNRSMLHVDEPMLAAFGVPGYYVERSMVEREGAERGAAELSRRWEGIPEAYP